MEDIPFDLKHYSHIVYGGSIASLKSDLEKRLRYFSEHPEMKAVTSVDSLEFYVAGEVVRESSIITIDLPTVGQTVRDRIVAENVDLSFAVKNMSPKSVDISEFQFAVVFPEEFARPSASAISGDFVRLPGGKLVHVSRPLHLDLFPGGWHTDQLVLDYRSPDSAPGKLYPCQVQILNAFGKREINFFLRVPPTTAGTEKGMKKRTGRPPG